MAKDTPAPKPARPTLAGQLAMQHELLMAQATKPARQGSQTIEYGERATGDKNGHLYFKSVVLVQHDGESDLQFLGRQEDYLRKAGELRDKLNAEQDTAGNGTGGEAA